MTILPFDSLTDRLITFIDRSRSLWGRPASDLLPDIERRLEALRAHEATVADALLVVLVGGTKVGKTTLINALAGREIGVVSARACLTSRPALFVHRSREAWAKTRLRDVLATGDTIACHDAPDLERIAIIDTPDLDGIEQAHHAVFHRVLEQADLALCLLTTQKYDSHALFEVLAQHVTFRRLVFIFNRIDEGIPLTEKIRNDLQAKTSPFGLRPPEGGTIPIFAVSAQNALLEKTGHPSGPTGQFAELERFLQRTLTAAVVQRISEENLVARGQETALEMMTACRSAEARGAADTLERKSLELLAVARSRLTAAVSEVLSPLQAEIGRQRQVAALESVTGPFGLYVRAYLALSAIGTRLSLFLSTGNRDLGDLAIQQILAEIEPTVHDLDRDIDRAIADITDHAGLDSTIVLEHCKRSRHEIRRSESEGTRQRRLARPLREFLVAAPAGPWVGLLLNLLPIGIILLLMRYFLGALLSAREPGSGIFLGCGLLLWVICHIQAILWLGRLSGNLTMLSLHTAEILALDIQTRSLSSLQSWIDQVRATELNHPIPMKHPIRSEARPSP